MLAFVLHKTNKYKKENQEQQYFVFEKQTFLEHFDKEDNHSVISNCLITNYTKPETYNKQILDLYKEKDTKMFPKLKGEFSFGIWDKQKQTFFGGRDRVGVKPFYYYNDDDIFIYSSTLKYIKDYFGFTELNEYWIADALSGIVYDKTSTQFPKIFRMPPAHYMLVNKEKFEIIKYWELKVNKIENISEEEAIKMFREKLFEAVNTRFFPNITGTELSGGLDSSGVTSIAAIRAKEMDSKLYSYSQRLADKYIGKIPPYKDEREYSDLVAKMYPNIILRPITAEDRGIIEPMKKVIDIIGAPVQNPLTYYFDEMFETAQKDGVKLLLSGFGGDQVVSNHGKHYLYDLAYANKWKKLSDVTNKSLFSKLILKYYLETKHKKIYKTLTKNKKNWKQKKIEQTLVNKEYYKKLNVYNRYWKRYDTSMVKTLDDLILYEFNEHYLTHRLEQMQITISSFGIDQSHPLLDINLIQTYINLPNYLKYNLQINRTLFRNSLKNIISKATYLRQDKQMATVPTTIPRIKKDLDFIYNINNPYTDILEYKQQLKFLTGSWDDRKKNNINLIGILSSLSIHLYYNKIKNTK